VTERQIYYRLFKYTFPYLRYGLMALLGYTLFAASQPAFAMLMKAFIEALEAKSTDGLYHVPAAAVAIAVARGVGTYLGSYYIARVGQSVVHDLRCEMFNKLMRLPVTYFDQNKDGHLVSRITFNVNNVASAITTAVKIIVREGLTVIGLLSYMLWISWQLTLVMLIVVPFSVLMIRWVSKSVKKAGKGIQDAMGEVNHAVAEGARGIRLIKSSGATPQVSANFKSVSGKAKKISLKLVKLSSIYTPVMQVIIICTMAIVMYIVLLASHQYETSTLIAYITAAGLLPKSVRALSTVYTTVLMGIIAAQSLFAQLDELDEPDLGNYAPDNVNGDLEIAGVSFTYPGHARQVLSDVSFTAKKGQTVAIVGRSGSGKSTLVNLIPRFYEATEGQITLDGIPISDWSLSALRSNVSLVSQQVVLMNDTIYSNICYGIAEELDPEIVFAAAKAANAHDFIMELPLGYGTAIGDDGILLSGGQRQRLSIARAILADSPILLLDEATAALDNESETLIQEELENFMEERTTIVIAHRLSTIEQADLILVMEDGKVVERGNRDQLLAKRGAYYKLSASTGIEVSPGAQGLL
jgi:subfamily B ATP-binding cassette protein MsbA